MKIENTNEVVLSVGEYLERLNIALGQEAGFVEGEVIGFKESAQWVFFSLQDSGEVVAGGEGSLPSGAPKERSGVLSCGLLAHEYRRIGVRIEDGMRVKIFGNPRITPKSGRFGMWVKSIEPVGEGSLKKAYELLLKKLTQEGLFARERELPDFVSRIGVISSREGVVLQDLRKNLRRLNLRISFVHTQVEGAGAVPGLLRALKYFAINHDKYDCVVVIRGGGSLESLQAFNNEEVVRAIYAMPVPVIAGIGHDVDVPIAALVADVMASTPTAVAHVVNDTWTALTETLPFVAKRIFDSQNLAIYRNLQGVQIYVSKISGYFQNIFRSFDNLIALFNRNVDKMGEYLLRASTRVRAIEELLKLADPGRSLKLGYSISTDKSGKIIRSTKQVRKGERIETRVEDGSIRSEVI